VIFGRQYVLDASVSFYTHPLDGDFPTGIQWHGKDEEASRLEDPVDLAECREVVGYMLDNF
jgi:hypothetical protein